jgi:hypothetical protein
MATRVLRLRISRVAANIRNKQSRKAEKFVALQLKEFAKTLHANKGVHYEMLHRASDMNGFFEKRKRHIGFCWETKRKKAVEDLYVGKRIILKLILTQIR